MSYSPRQLAEAFIQTGELDDALDTVSQYLTTAPDDEDMRRLRIEICSHLDDPTHIRLALEDMQYISTWQPPDYMIHSVLLEKAGQRQDSINVLREAYDRHPDDERLIERYVHLLRVQGSVDEAQAVVARMIGDQPDSWRWLQWAGDLEMDAQDYAAAEAYYSSAIDALEQRYAISAHDTAAIRTEAHAAPAAVLAVYARLRIARGYVLAKLEQLEQADDDYAAAARLIPDDAMIPFRRGLLAAKRGDMETTKQLCTHAFDLANETLRQVMLDDPEWGVLGL